MDNKIKEAEEKVKRLKVAYKAVEKSATLAWREWSEAREELQMLIHIREEIEKLKELRVAYERLTSEEPTGSNNDEYGNSSRRDSSN